MRLICCCCSACLFSACCPRRRDRTGWSRWVSSSPKSTASRIALRILCIFSPSRFNRWSGRLKWRRVVSKRAGSGQSVEDERNQSSSAIRRWLNDLGLGQYGDAFEQNDLDVDVLDDLSELDLEKIGVSLGHRKKLMRATTAKVDVRGVEREDREANASWRSRRTESRRST